MSDIIWVSWMKHQRNRSLTTAIGVELYEYKSKAGRIMRYLQSILWTIKLILTKRPAVVVCTNPSIVLSYFLLSTRKLFGFALAVDAHFVGIEAPRGWERFQWVLDWLNKRVDLVIVTNAQHAGQVQALGGKAFVCPDPLPSLPQVPTLTGIDFEKSVFLICSFDVDEPYAEVFAAFEQMLQADGYKLYVSGNYGRAGIEPNGYKAVTFLGFVPMAEYLAYLRQCSVIIDLTMVENCLVCGAYEAVAANKPLVLSNTKASMDYFRDAAIYTENKTPAIAENIRRAYAQRTQLSHRTAQWASENMATMAIVIQGLRDSLQAVKVRT